MELKFQNPLDLSPPKPKSFRSTSGKKNKFLGVRQRPFGKWVAEIKNTTQKIRMWLGTFDTAEEAAMAYDEAAYLLRGSNTRKNVADHCPSNSLISLKINSLLNQKKASKQIQTSIPTNSPNKTIKKTSSRTSCLVLPSDFNREFNILNGELPENIFSFNPPTKTSSQTSSLQSHSENASPATSGCSIQDFQIFDDDVYRPDLSQCLNEEENGIGSVQFGQAHGDELYQFLSQKEELLVPESDILVPKSDILMPEMSVNRFPAFEQLKVERQISASLYAMNEVDEYWQNFNNPSDCLWDLQMVYQMFYSS